jgi:hypothetical protein
VGRAHQPAASSSAGSRAASITLGTKVVSPTSVKQWVSSGTAGTEYSLLFQATTAGGRTKVDTMIIPVSADRE